MANVDGKEKEVYSARRCLGGSSSSGQWSAVLLLALAA